LNSEARNSFLYRRAKKLDNQLKAVPFWKKMGLLSCHYPWYMHNRLNGELVCLSQGAVEDYQHLVITGDGFVQIKFHALDTDRGLLRVVQGSASGVLELQLGLDFGDQVLITDISERFLHLKYINNLALDHSFASVGMVEMNQLASGKRVFVRIPDELPEPYNKFGPTWIDYITKLNGENVILVEESAMGIAGPLMNTIKGWTIDVPAPSGVCSWLPPEWLHLTDKYAVPCDCPLPLVLRDGCKNPQHE